MNLVLNTTKTAKQFGDKIVNFVKNSKAVAAVEFALIAPILLILFIGTVEISLLVAVDRKISRTSSAIADLVAQDSDYTGVDGEARLRALLGVTERIMFPYTSRIPCVVISVVYAEAESDTNGDGNIDDDDDVTSKVVHSIDNKTTHPDYLSPESGQCNKSSLNLGDDEIARQKRAEDSEFPVPEMIKTHDTTLVVAEVEYDHKPIIGFVSSSGTAKTDFDKAAVTIGDRIYLRPRKGSVNF